jgi:hypothetical protein
MQGMDPAEQGIFHRAASTAGPLLSHRPLSGGILRRTSLNAPCPCAARLGVHCPIRVLGDPMSLCHCLPPAFGKFSNLQRVAMACLRTLVPGRVFLVNPPGESSNCWPHPKKMNSNGGMKRCCRTGRDQCKRRRVLSTHGMLLCKSNWKMRTDELEGWHCSGCC